MVDDRLLETSDLPLERELLRAAAEEAPPSATRVRALAALGLLSVATPAAAATSAAATGTAATTAGHAGLLGAHWIFKWGLVLGLGASAVGGAVVAERSLRGGDAEVVSSAIEPTVSPAPTAAEERQGVGPEVDPDSEEIEAEVPPEERTASVEHEAMPARPVPTGSRARPAPKTPAVPTGAVSIREEVQLLDRARAQVARHAPEAALATLGEYASRYPQGALREEAAVIRIEALRASGRRQAAGREAQEFHQEYPTSAHIDAGSR